MEWVAIAWPVFLVVLIVRGLLSAFTKVLYRKRPMISLGLGEHRIIRGDASFNERLQVLGSSLFSGMFSLNVYLLTALIASCIYGVQKYL